MSYSSNKSYSHYLDSGIPFVKEIDLTGLSPTSGDTFTVGNMTYTLGTDVFWRPSVNLIEGLTEALVHAINGYGGTYGDFHTRSVDNPKAYARQLGGRVIIYGRVPGDDFTLSADTGQVNTLVTGSTEGSEIDANDWNTHKADFASSPGSYNTLPTGPAKVVMLVNNNDFDLEYRKSGSSDEPVTLPMKTADQVNVSANSNEIEIRKADASGDTFELSFRRTL